MGYALASLKTNSRNPKRVKASRPNALLDSVLTLPEAL